MLNEEGNDGYAKEEIMLSEFITASGELNFEKLQQTLIASGPVLTKVDLRGLNAFRKRRTRKHESNILSEITEHCPNITHLQLEFLTSDQVLIDSLVQLKKLENLHIKFCTDLKDKQVITVLNHCPLKVLDLTGCQTIEGKFLNNQYANLTSLHLEGCSKLVKLKIPDGTLKLKTITCDKDTSCNVKYIILASRLTLENLILKKSGILNFLSLVEFSLLKSVTLNNRIKDFQGFENFCNSHVELKELHIDFSSPSAYVAQEEPLMHLGNVSNLKSLSMQQLPCCSDVNLTFWADKLHLLTKLNLAGCSRISDNGTRRVLRQCKSLEYFNLCGCTRVTSATLNCARSVVNEHDHGILLQLVLAGTRVTQADVESVDPSPKLTVIMEEN